MSQTMIKHISALSVLLCISSGLAATDKATSQRLNILERQVANLQQQVQALAAENRKLRTQVASIAPTDYKEATTCSDRLAELQEKRAQLRKLGFKDSHPDIINVQQQIETAQSDCKNS